MKTLFEIFKENNDRTIHKWMYYFPVYERHLSKYRNTPVKVLEIGVSEGGSLQMWKKYFGESATIVGIDIYEQYKFEEDQISVEIGSQSDTKFLGELIEKYGSFDIIIDDGSHVQTDVLTSFFFLYPFLNDDGCYIIEDGQTSYFELFQGGINSPTNMFSVIREYIHDLNSDYIKEPYEQTLKNVSSMCFYDSMIAIEKSSKISNQKHVLNFSKDRKKISDWKSFLGEFMK